MKTKIFLLMITKIFLLLLLTAIFPSTLFAHRHMTVNKDKKLVKRGLVGQNLWTNFETGANVKAMAFEGKILWMGLPNGLIKYDTSTLNSHTIYTSRSTKGGLISNGIFAISIDKENNKWIGTYGGGVTRFDDKNWTTYNPYGYGDSRVYGDSWTSLKMGKGLADLWVYDFLFSEEKIFIATWKGVSIFDGKKFTNYSEADGLIDKWVYSLGKDKKGRYWFGTEGGITMFDKGKFKSYTHEDGVGAKIQNEKDAPDFAPKHHSNLTKTIVTSNPNYILSIAIDKDDNKWFGTWGAGLSVFDDKTWKTYTKKDGLGGNFIHTLAVDQDGILWAGTDGGISFFINDKWYNYSKDDGLINNNVFSIAFDENGGRWFGTWTGITKLEILFR